MLHVLVQPRIYQSPVYSLHYCHRPSIHVLFSLWTDLGLASLFERRFCVLVLLKSWKVHQNDLVFGSCFCILCCLWIERNKRCFDGISTPISSLKARCVISRFRLFFFVVVLGWSTTPL
ncbi:hypothetical protein AABB24_011548 [Solanum stoloniferum]|uniref:Uncharacterized protein n=1 Tax=Solanum stoloniferum TaxID=62892 RepID=A0ABD2UET1_9SOLN